MITLARQFGSNSDQAKHLADSSPTPPINLPRRDLNAPLSSPAAQRTTEQQTGPSLRPQPSVSLPSLSHDLIAAKNPFLDIVEAPDSELLGHTEAAEEPPVAEIDTMSPTANVRAVYITPQGASALIDGQLVPIHDPGSTVKSLKNRQGE